METFPKINFDDTAIAFERKNNRDLKETAWLFGMMNRPWLVNLGSKMTLLALQLHLPIQGIIKRTIFKQFCGGTSLDECQTAIQQLAQYQTKTVLDYGVEAKENEADFQATVQENIKAIRFAGKNGNVPIVSVKVTGFTRFALLEKVTSRQPLNAAEQTEWEQVTQRLDSICMEAADHHVAIFVDAEESWIQDAIDDLAMLMMERYNKQKPVIYNTFQLYRHDRLAYLKASFAIAQEKNFILGAKMVRGAYMEKERERAQQMGYPSPIQPNKEATDRDYNAAVQFCIDNYERIAACVASHNQYSTQLQADAIVRLGLPTNHPHLTFCQLYGMGDNLTFNLAKAGFYVSKYMPYGAVKDVVPYLIRRAQENSSVNGDVSRELKMVRSELARRK